MVSDNIEKTLFLISNIDNTFKSYYETKKLFGDELTEPVVDLIAVFNYRLFRCLKSGEINISDILKILDILKITYSTFALDTLTENMQKNAEKQKNETQK